MVSNEDELDCKGLGLEDPGNSLFHRGSCDSTAVVADLEVALRRKLAQLQPVQRRLAGNRRAILTPRCELGRGRRRGGRGGARRGAHPPPVAKRAHSVARDSGFAREDLMAWCEANGVDFLFGMAKNERLIAEIMTELDLVAAAIPVVDAVERSVPRAAQTASSSTGQCPRRQIN
jgi:Transposase DDE domain group 1